MKKLRVGVVGVGHIGSNHARIYAELPHAEFVAVFDIDPARAAEIATKYKAKAAGSLDEFAEMVDAASVATPTNAHFSVARDLLARGKHLLIEKPITENTADARELAQRAAEKRLVLQVGHVERFNPVLSALEQRLTHPRFIEAHRLSPYPNRSTEIGVVLDLMIHDLEIILHLVNSTVENYRRGRRAGAESRRRYCQCPITFRQRLYRQRYFQSHQSGTNAQNPGLPGGRLSLVRLSGTKRRNLPPRQRADHARRGRD